LSFPLSSPLLEVTTTHFHGPVHKRKVVIGQADGLCPRLEGVHEVLTNLQLLIDDAVMTSMVTVEVMYVNVHLGKSPVPEWNDFLLDLGGFRLLFFVCEQRIIPHKIVIQEID
jgi:hypothetical protein